MGIALPQLAPASEDRVSGALSVDGSLRFDDTKKNYLKQTIGNGTNGFTISCWMKPCQTGNRDEIFDTIASPGFYLYRHTDGSIRVNNDSVNLFISNGKYVDTTAFLNIVFSYDSTSSYGSLYVNGRLDKTTEFTTQLYAGTAKISSEASTDPANYYLGQWYLIDGLALGPGYFGYTDPLTGVWRPKKFRAEGTTANDGTRWRNYLTASNGSFHADPYGATAAFNGVVSSGSGGYCQAANGSANPNSITFDVSSIGGIPFKNSVEVWLINNANTVTVNGGEAQSIAGTTFVTVARGPGVLNTIVFERPSTNGASLGTIRVDGVNLRDDLTQYVQFGAEGFYLPMDGKTLIGKNQAPSINDGTVWSDSLTSTQNFNLAVTRAFDGDTTTLAATANASNANILWTQTVSNVKTLRVYMDHDFNNYRVRVNGGSWHVDNTLGATQNSDWRDLTSLIPSNGIITSIESDTGGLNNGVNWSAVEINGDILIDSTTEKGNDWRPMNFGGSNSIEKATGAKPILNTGNGGTTARPGVFGSDVSATYTTTSASNSGGKYVFENEGTQPTFSFVRGATYTFDWSASSGHPLRFATAADAAGSTEYTDGTNVSGNVTKITVPHNAPDTLYYYCNVHNGMGNSISVTTDETKADPYAWKNVLAMPLVGDKEDVSASVNCTTTTKTITSNGDPAASTLDSNFYGGSYEFDGTDDCLTSSDCGSGATQYTMECWVNTDGFSQSQRPINMSQDLNGNRYLYAEITTAKKLQIREESTGSAVSADAVFEANKWHHVAVSYDGSRLMGFVDGVLVIQTTAGSTVALGNTMKMRVGADESNTSANEFDGHIQDVRVYFGACKYTAADVGDQAFIPASTNPDILPDTPSGVATKSKLKKITDGAVSFDGTGDYLSTTSSSSDFTFGTGDFTIEMFLYNRETGGKGFIQFSDSSGGLKNTSSGVVTIHKDAGQNGVFRAYAKNSSTAFSTPVPYKQWCHVALVRESGTVKLFVDGKLDATTISSDTINYATTYVAIGGYYDTNYLSDCTISNVRVNKGTALYTSDFIPPTEPLTNVTNTKLLTCQTPTTYQIAAVAPLVSGINDGTVWSSSITSDSLFRSGFPAANAFNGDTKSSTNDCAATPQTAGQGFAFTFGEGVPFTTLQMQCDDNNGGYVFVNGVDITSQLPTGSLTNTTITGVTSPLTSIRLISHNGDAAYLGSVTIDGTMLRDPLTIAGDAATTNFNPFNTDINTVSGQEGSYVTLNSIDPRSYTNGPTYTLQNGNLTAYMVGGNTNASKDRGLVASTIDLPNDGKWYCEVNTEYMQNDDVALGIASDIVKGYYETGSNAKPGAYLLRQNGTFYYPTGQLGSDSSRQYNSGDYVGIAVDLADPKITFYKNGRILYSHSVDLGQGPFKFAAGTDAGGTSGTYTFHFNFGQKPFKFPPPDGFQPLTSTTLRPDTVITRPDKFVSAITYTGNSTAQNLGGSSPSQNATVVGGTITNPRFAFNGSSANWANLTADTTSTAAHVDFAVNLTGITRIEAAFDSPSGSGDTRGRYNGANAGNTRTGTGSGYSDIYNGSAITVTSVGFGINQNGQTGTNNDVVSRFRITDSQGTRFIVDRTDEGLRFKPDFVWLKNRSGSTPYDHLLFDTVRGATKYIKSNSTAIEQTNASTLSSFDSNGFTLGSDNEINASAGSASFVAWAWKAGGNAGTFNIDDVDMGSAANAKMSAGSLNNDAYDQSQRWRDNITSSNGWNTSYPVANIFNGSFDGGGGAANNGNGGVITFTPPAAITVTKLELSCYSPVTVTLPDGTTREVAGVGSANKDVTVDIGSGFSFTGSNSITISRTSSFIYLERIKINGKELVDDDITPANVPSIPATACSVGTKQGFSIIKYAGSGSNSTFPHGLTQAPDFYIVKCLDVSNESWRVYHSSVGATKALTLNSGSEPSASNVFFNDTEPTSTVASVYAGYDGVNNTGRNYIAYCWHDVPGLQKFGSYVANGSADGPFVEVGFRPAVVWCKVIQTGVSDNWAIQDTARAQFNTYDSTIRLNDNANEVVNSGNYYFDFTSNGFKIKNTNGEYNGSNGWQYIYCAWAEAPVSNLYGAQSSAF